MPIQAPGKRYCKRLQKSRVFGEGAHAKKVTYADLLITPLVDTFVIIVLFLIANFSATGEVLNMDKNIQLPEASHVEQVKLAPVVMVSNEQVIFDGQVIGRVEDLTREDYLNIPTLEEKLRDNRRKVEDLHSMVKDSENGFNGEVNIQGNKDVQFKIIKRVMFSCATAGFQNINFAVLNKGGEGGGPPTPGAPGAAGPAVPATAKP